MYDRPATLKCCKNYSILTSTKVEKVDGRFGCAQEDNVVTYYDSTDEYTTKRLDCKYEMLAVGEKCTNAALQTGDMSVEECAEKCDRAFYTKQRKCYCAQDKCLVRTDDADAKSFRVVGDACNFVLLQDNTQCLNTTSVKQLDLISCIRACQSEGYTSLHVKKGFDECQCSTDNCFAKGANQDYKVMRIMNFKETPENFVRVYDKSCEHYGHRTILDEELCSRAASEMGLVSRNIFSDSMKGKCANNVELVKLSGGGYCSDYAYPDGGSGYAGLYTTPQACYLRCQERYPGTTHFYIDTSSGNGCACCKDTTSGEPTRITSDTKFETYKVTQTVSEYVNIQSKLHCSNRCSKYFSMRYTHTWSSVAKCNLDHVLYTIKRVSPPLTYPFNNDNTFEVLGQCQADCDNDDECIGDLTCFHRNSGAGDQPVPGCDNTDVERLGEAMIFVMTLV